MNLYSIMKKKILVAFIIWLSFPILLKAQPVKPIWTLYGKSKTNDMFYYYDASSVKKLANGVYIVWTKNEDNPDSLAAIRQALIETRERLKLYDDPNPIEKNRLHRYDRG